MKIWYFVLTVFLTANLTLNSSCKKEKEDLTVKVVGEYVGTYGKPTGGVIENFTVVVSKVDHNTIRIEPKEGSEFEAWESDIEKSDDTFISAPTGNGQQFEATLSFLTVPGPVVFSFIRAQIGDMFQGEKR